MNMALSITKAGDVAVNRDENLRSMLYIGNSAKFKGMTGFLKLNYKYRH